MFAILDLLHVWKETKNGQSHCLALGVVTHTQDGGGVRAPCDVMPFEKILLAKEVTVGRRSFLRISLASWRH